MSRLYLSLKVFLVVSVWLVAQAMPVSGSEVPIAVSKIHFYGNTVFADSQLAVYARDVVGRNDVTLTELEEVLQDVTRLYRQHGYPLAFAYLPEQEIEDGNVQVNVVEGRYSHITIENASSLKESVAGTQLGTVQSGAIIHSRSLDESLRRLNWIPGVRAHSVLAPGQESGTAELIIELHDKQRSYNSVSLDNFGNPYVGRWRRGLAVERHNLTGLGDRLSLHMASSGAGLVHGRLEYTLPPERHPYRWSLSYATTRYELGGAFTALDAYGKAGRYGIGFHVAPIRISDLNLNVSVGYVNQEMSDTVLGDTTKRSSGVLNATVAGERSVDSGIERFSLQVISGQLRFPDPIEKAKDDLTAKTAGQFTKATINVSRAVRMSQDSTLHASLSGQWASKNLHASEKFSLGGPTGVRAYPSGEASGDMGWLARIETQRRLWRDTSHIIGFADIGSVRIDKTPWVAGENHRTLYGIGLGVSHVSAEDVVLRFDYAMKIGDLAGSKGRGHLWFRAMLQF